MEIDISRVLAILAIAAIAVVTINRAFGALDEPDAPGWGRFWLRVLLGAVAVGTISAAEWGSFMGLRFHW